MFGARPLGTRLPCSWQVETLVQKFDTFKCADVAPSRKTYSYFVDLHAWLQKKKELHYCLRVLGLCCARVVVFQRPGRQRRAHGCNKNRTTPPSFAYSREPLPCRPCVIVAVKTRTTPPSLRICARVSNRADFARVAAKA